MATKTGPTNLPAYFSTDADFEAFVAGIHAALTTLGFVQTADTGQINPATVSKPGGANSSMGYEIWRFADTLQATAPLFFKIEYGSSAAASTPSIWFTPGSGSDGAGAMTGQTGTRQQCGSGGAKSAGVSLPLYTCSDGSDLTLAGNVDTATTNFGFLVHFSRTRDNNGAATNDGAWFYTTSGRVYQGSSQFIARTGSSPAAQASAFPGVSPELYSRSTVGENADVCPPLLPVGGNWRYTRLLLTAASDFGAGGTFTTTLFGATHTFVALSKTCGDGTLTNNNGSGNNPGLAMPWE